MGLLLAMVIGSSFSWALSPEDRNFLEQFKGKIKVGMEIEIGDRPLSQLIRHFDVKGYQEQFGVPENISPDVLNSYLDDPISFSLLPPDLQAELQSGLGSTHVELQAREVPTLLNAQGQHLKPEDRVRIITGHSTTQIPESVSVPKHGLTQRQQSGTQQGIIIPQSITGPAKNMVVRQSGLLVSQSISEQLEEGARQRNWWTVVERWKALPPERKRTAIRLERLRPIDLATLVEDQIIDIAKLKIRADLPEHLKEMYRSTEWKYDRLGIIEVTHPQDRPFDDPISYLDHVQKFAHLAGIEQLMKKPAEVLAQGLHGDRQNNHHFHLSFTNPPKDLDTKLQMENLYRLLSYSRRGVQPDGSTERAFNYQSTDAKGLVRKVGHNHIEIRAQQDEPAVELVSILKRLTIDSEAVSALASVMRPEALNDVFRYHSLQLDNFLSEVRTIVAAHPELLPRISHPSTRSLIQAISDSKTKSIPELIELASNPNPKLAAIALTDLRSRLNGRKIQAIEKIKLTQLLVNSVSHPDPAIAISIIRILGQAGSELSHEALATLINAVEHSNSDVARTAMEALGGIKNPKAVPALIRAVSHTNPRSRIKAIYSLGRIGNTQAVPALIIAAEDTHAGVAQEAIFTLGTLKSREAEAVLLRAAIHRNTAIATAAIKALGKIHSPGAVPLLIQTVSHSVNPDVVREAISALGSIGSSAAIPVLSSLVRRGTRDIAAAAIGALGAIGTPEVVPLLLNVAENAEYIVANGALWAINEIRNPEAVPALVEALQHVHPNTASAIIAALGEIKSPLAVAALIETIDHPNYDDVGRYAIRTLARIGSPEAVTGLKHAARHGDRHVADEATPLTIGNSTKSTICLAQRIRAILRQFTESSR